MADEERFLLSSETTGADLAQNCLTYLKENTSKFESQTTVELIRAIKASSGDFIFDFSERDWARLADAALAIGSGALDRVTRRLTIQGTAKGWSTNFDYRPLAAQIHALAGPARKIRNAVAHRAKCTRAVLKVHDLENAVGFGHELTNMRFSTADEVRHWQKQSFYLFEEEGTVNSRFHLMYQKEWKNFCDEYNSLNFEITTYSTESLQSIVEKYLLGLTHEASKFNLKWNSVTKSESTSNPLNSNLISNITYDFKRKADQFTISIRIPNMNQSNYNSISIDLMELIELKTGLRHVDAMRGSKDPDLLNIDVYGAYTINHIRLALSEIEKYFQQKYPSGSK
jgi:hypothetical protein